MFGAIWALISGAAIAKYKIDEFIDDENARWDSLVQGKSFYYRSDGSAILHANGHRVITTHLPNREYVLKDLTSGRIIRNYTREKQDRFSEQQKQWAREEGRSAYCCWYDFYYPRHILQEYYPKGIRGSRFKDFRTGAVYVIRKFKSWENPYKKDMCFYVDPDRELVVRPIDYEYRFGCALPGAVDEIVAGLNMHIYDKLYGPGNHSAYPEEYREMVHRDGEVKFHVYEI